MARLRDLVLRPLTPEDYPTLYEWACTPVARERWTYAEGDLGPESFLEQLWAGVHEHQVLCTPADTSPLAVLTSYSSNWRTGSCYVAAATQPDRLGSGIAMYGAGMFVTALFDRWPYRRIHLQAHEHNLAKYRSMLRRVARIDGVMREDLEWEGSLHDLYVLTIEREAWESAYGATIRRRHGPEDQGPSNHA